MGILKILSLCYNCYSQLTRIEGYYVRKKYNKTAYDINENISGEVYSDISIEDTLWYVCEKCKRELKMKYVLIVAGKLN